MPITVYSIMKSRIMADELRKVSSVVLSTELTLVVKYVKRFKRHSARQLSVVR